MTRGDRHLHRRAHVGVAERPVQYVADTDPRPFFAEDDRPQVRKAHGARHVLRVGRKRRLKTGLGRRYQVKGCAAVGWASSSGVDAQRRRSNYRVGDHVAMGALRVDVDADQGDKGGSFDREVIPTSAGEREQQEGESAEEAITHGASPAYLYPSNFDATGFDVSPKNGFRRDGPYARVETAVATRAPAPPNRQAL